MFFQAYDCQLTLEKIIMNYYSLSDNYDLVIKQYFSLKQQYNEDMEKKDKLINEKERSIFKSEKFKKIWRKIALIEGGVIVTVIIIVILI